METSQPPPQVSVTGSIVIQGQLTAPNSPDAESETPVPPSPFCQFWHWIKNLDYTGIGTISLAIATFSLALLAYCSLQDMRTAINSGQKAFQLSERAFVVPSLAITQPGPSEDFPLLVVPTFRNEGNTQTVELGVWLETNGLFSQGTYPQRLDPKTAWRNKLWLGPKQSISVEGLSMPVRKADVATYKANPSQHWLLYRGAFDYYDVFKHEGTTLHFQRFCYAIWNNPVITGQDRFSFSECTGAGENCADAECAPQ
jgi:hypothetical protein